jgi:hypothetical protein
LIALPTIIIVAIRSAAAAAELPSQANLIERLQSARNIDQDAALDPSVSPFRQGTFLNQMNKADRVMNELRHGIDVPPGEINDALWTPPNRLTPQARARLIQQLQEARQQDDRNEQQTLNDQAWSNSAFPPDTTTFDERKTQIDEMVKSLQSGNSVRWSDLHHALTVPASPY